MTILVLGKRGIFMQEEKVQVSKREFNPNHGSLKAIFTLNVINVISLHCRHIIPLLSLS